jgi:large subunit ribosomal protein L17
MRHLVKGRKLGRTASHRKATLASLAVALIEERRITTTVAKAKELRRFVEPLITKAKVDTTHNRRLVFSKLNDKYAVTELFEEVGPLAKDRPGGYTRVLKLGFRQGDGAELAMIELVDYNDHPPEVITGKKKRTRRAGKSKKAEPVTESSQDTAAVKKTDEKEEAVKAAAAQDEPQAEPAREEPVAESGPESEVAETTESKTDEPGKEAKAKAEDAEAEAGKTSTDFNVDEVKEKIQAMSVDEAKAFIGDDERVTVQKALQKKIDDASAEGENEK